MSLKHFFPIIIFLLTIAFLFSTCDSGIENSPAPGIVRVTLESDPSDTVIIIVTDTLTVSDDDIFWVSIFQGRVFRDDTYGILYPRLESTRQEEKFYNIIWRQGGQYQRFTIFESHLPPQSYNKIEFGVDSRFLKLKNFDLIDVITPDNYFIKLPADFEIKSNKVTEVNIRVKPFKSVTRFRDSYIFQPEMEIFDVKYF